MKKLIPAICLLLVSAVLLGASTFAWFSANTKVTAENLEITATVSKNLLISKDNTNFAESTDLAITANTLYPVSTIGGDVASPAFFEVDNVGGIITTSAARTATTTFKTAETTHYVKTTVYLKTIGTNGTNLVATINTTSGGSADLDPSLRVMLVDKTNNKTYIYEPIAGASYLTGTTALSAADGTNAAVATIKTSGTDTILATMTADTVYTFDIYVWYEGEDPACKTVNAQTLAATNFSIDFQCA